MSLLLDALRRAADARCDSPPGRSRSAAPSGSVSSPRLARRVLASPRARVVDGLRRATLLGSLLIGTAAALATAGYLRYERHDTWLRAELASTAAEVQALAQPSPQAIRSRAPIAPLAAADAGAARRQAAGPVEALSGPVQTPAGSAAAASVSAARAGSLQITRNNVRNPVAASLAAGYAGLLRGDTHAAGHHYASALRVQAGNRDALLGLAAVARARGDHRRARDLYRTLLDSAPFDAALHLALGAAYGREGRWSDARAAFLEAHRLDGDNPDAYFNLAVSLDHLNEIPAARAFYRKALRAAVRRPARFALHLARERLQALGPDQGGAPP